MAEIDSTSPTSLLVDHPRELCGQALRHRRIEGPGFVRNVAGEQQLGVDVVVLLLVALKHVDRQEAIRVKPRHFGLPVRELSMGARRVARVLAVCFCFASEDAKRCDIIISIAF